MSPAAKPLTGKALQRAREQALFLLGKAAGVLLNAGETDAVVAVINAASSVTKIFRKCE